MVFVTKYRRGALNDNLLAWHTGDFAKMCETMQAKLLACSGEDDHVHLLVEYPPKLSVTALVNALKSTSSHLLRKERPDFASRY